METLCPRILALITVLALVKFNSVQCQDNTPPEWDFTSVDILSRGISEDTKAGAFLTQLKCDDNDGDMIYYQLLKGKAVTVRSTGEVYLSVPLDFEKKDSIGYDLAFGCRDLKPSGSFIHNAVEIEVELTINDANDQAPGFNALSDEGYSFSVNEDDTRGFVLSPAIEVKDLDRTSNAELSYLYIICDSPFPSEKVDLPESSVATCEKFTLNYTNLHEGHYQANLNLKAPLDFETRRVYSSKLVAIDNPINVTQRLSTTINIQINVGDAQDMDPVFTNPGSSTLIVEEGKKGDFVNMQISAKDGDVGDRRPVKIEIIEDPRNAFYLEPAVPSTIDEGVYTAQIRVENGLDREKLTSSYSFVVKVTELDKVTLAETTATATATYSVQVSDIDDQAPEFEQPIYRVNVTEMEFTTESVQLTAGLRVVVVDADEAQNARYNVRVISQSLTDAYSVSPAATFTGTAILFLKVNNVAYLDYDIEAYRNQVVVLEAYSVGTTPKSSTATISIQLVDINDNTPQFDVPSYSLTVSEAIDVTQLPYKITTVHATDNDSGPNGDIRYKLEGGTSNRFEINPSTGELTLISLVDYETTPLYVFLVYAEDAAQSSRKSQVQVTVRVTNVNDKPPEFEQPFYQTSVNEDELKFLVPVNVLAEDDEEGTVGITYSIKSGQTADNAFFLNPNTGELSLTKYLRYQGNGVNTVVVEASDGGNPPLFGTASVSVTVIDQNNFPPVIAPKRYTAVLSELEKPGTLVATVIGSDADEGEFGKITYRIVSGGFDNFDIDPISGEVTVNDPQNFDFDQAKSYTVKVVGSDGGAPQLSDDAFIDVTITDANNKPPVFAETIYLKNVHEREDVGFPILTVSATDPDSSNDLTYTILEDTIIGRNGAGSVITNIFRYNYKEAVEINSKTGVISIKNKLNKDQLLVITFVVQVKDLNAQTLNQVHTSRVAITVIGEANRNLTFDPLDQIFVNEGSQKGYGITTVVARDPTNQLDLIKYRQLTPSSFFEVVENSGEVRLKNKIDYETDPHTHVIPIVAVAQDGIRSVSTTVTIKIRDDNDNPPEFDRAEYVATVDEDSPPLTPVISIYATDKDTPTYGPVAYRIAGGLDSDHFDLYTTAQGVDVYVARGVTLDFNSRDYYELDVIALDNPNKRFSSVQQVSSVKLKITVIDKNNHAPQFLDQDTTRRFAVSETANIGKSVGNVVAIDADFGLNGDVSYFLDRVDGDPTSDRALQLFTVVERGGIIQVMDSLLGFGGNVYQVRVVARDNGVPFLQSTLDLQVEVLRTENNDGNPIYYRPDNNHVYEFPEETSGEKLKDRLGNPKIFEVAPRTGNNITFSLSDLSDSKDSFQINKITGEITVVEKLDRELKETYNLLVYAEDTTNPTVIRTGRQIIVKLTDKNDNRPSFTNPMNYTACNSLVILRPLDIYFNENIPKDTVVYTLRACDLDSNDITYYYLDDRDPHCAKMNAEASPVIQVRENGQIVTKISVDYEQYQSFGMCVVAMEDRLVGGGRKKRALDYEAVGVTKDNVAYISIHVNDLNDNKPLFPKPQVAAVMVTSARDYPVVVLDATDSDGKGYNTPRYVITDTKFYPSDSNAPTSPGRAFVIKNNEIHPDPPRGFTFEDFSGGRFELTVKAEDQVNSTFYDTQIVTIYVYKQGQAMKVILNMSPTNGFQFGEEIVQNLDAVSKNHEFQYLHVSVHNSKEGIVKSKTDVCFIAVDANTHVILSVPEMVSLLDEPGYLNVLSTAKFQTLDRGKCYPSTSSEEQIKWRDLWWVLVIVAIFIAVCSLFFICIIFALHRRYRRYMKSEKTYLVPG